MTHRLACVAALLLCACSDPSNDAPASTGDGTEGGTSNGGTTGADSGGTADDGGAGGPYFHEDVSPILMEHCVKCHRPDGIAPFALIDYEDVALLGELIEFMTEGRYMPPIPADASGECNTFYDAKWLTDAELQTIADWVAVGTPEGDPASAQDVPEPPQGLENPDITADMGAEYVPSTPEGNDDYRCFVIDPGLTEDRFLTAYQVNPGETKVVHHVILFATRSAADSMAAQMLDADADGLGYPCFGGSGLSTQFVAGWAPGLPATEFPAGTGLRLLAGNNLVMQVHYNIQAGNLPDRTTIDMKLADTVDSEALIFGIRNGDFSLAPGQKYVETTKEVQLPGNGGTATIWGAAPHMHDRGETLRVTTGADETCIIDVPRWSFNWQRFYWYSEPLQVDAGGTATITCGYDTMTAEGPTTWGEGTDDEMCLNYVYATL